MNRKEIVALCLAALILAADVVIYLRQARVAGEITLCLPAEKVKP